MSHILWKSDYKRDVVYLHVLSRTRSRGVVNISPFAIKLELFLRINGIPFQTVDCDDFSSKQQSHFVLFNGEEIADHNHIIQHVSGVFCKDPYPGYGLTERAVGRAFMKMLEENTIWPIFIYRFIEHKDEYDSYIYPDCSREEKKKIIDKLQDLFERRAIGHGISRHSSDEIQTIGCEDVKALSDFLGSKQYLLGDRPSVVDCSLFGVLSQVLYVPIGYPMRTFLLDKCPNLVNLINRLRETFWANWNEECGIQVTQF
ncbi:failed axon connections-like isoform X2 [Dreissena polymorpha]|uniref:Uncharacterized protein n=2 Tax=Dreissena polymorpha TaxID=45954 RepID=A0A9D4IQM5_DREPO|nr:failed axon connections-like isoform X2 [Dreissena polymorpha]KAH3781477.1 hypothetical protein DPMN_159307 [Dreissena polymorpha]